MVHILCSGAHLWYSLERVTVIMTFYIRNEGAGWFGDRTEFFFLYCIEINGEVILQCMFNVFNTDAID